MAPVSQLNDDQLEQRAFSLLSRELGIEDTLRFLRLNRQGHGDYTADRHKWLDGITIQEIAEGARHIQAERKSRPGS